MISIFLEWKGAAIIFQELLEQEVTEFLGRRHYGRQKGENTGYRNGYEPYPCIIYF